MKLHLGCGIDKKAGYVNIDRSDQVNPDLVWDLEETPLPFEDNSITEVVANHVFEHLYNFVPLMHDLRRICVPGAKIKIKVPFYSTWGQYNDPTHVRFFSPFTFNYFQKGNYSHEVECKDNMFKINKVKINFGIGRASKLNWIMNPIINLHHAFYCRFAAWIIPSSEIEFELEVLK
ncbi:methyltransferase domain-containing protein [Candidatus Pacearchaeota archaeon]|nr:methyltransferase domain-containing protein [Candidatus Pacearchaeota archaeon]